MINFENWNKNINFYKSSNNFLSLIIEQDKQVLGFINLAYGKDTMAWGGITVSDYARKNNIHVMHYVNWWAIEKANELGLKYFDTVGYNPSKRDKREEGIFKFKKKLATMDKKYYILSYYKIWFQVINKLLGDRI